MSDDKRMLVLETPAASDAFTTVNNDPSFVINLKNKDDGHAHSRFNATPGFVREKVHRGESTQFRGRKLKGDPKEIQALGATLRKSGERDEFQSTMQFANFVIIALFILLELAFFPNPQDIHRYNVFQNQTVNGTSEDKLISSSIYGWRDWTSWDFDSEYQYCGYEREWVWTRDGGHHNHHLCMKNHFAFACLAVSRSSAVMMYILFSIVILSKLRFSLSILQTTAYADILPFHMINDYHTACGKILLVDAWLHTIGHCVRFLINADPKLFYASVTISGWWGLFVMNCICGVWWSKMTVVSCPAKALVGVLGRLFNMTFEREMVLHMSWTSFAFVMFFHRHRFGVYWAVLLAIFMLDRVLERCYMTTTVRDMDIKAGKSGTLIRFRWFKPNRKVPNVELAGSIVRVCLPSFSNWEYHPFSVFYDPHDPHYACVYIHKAGDWTTLLHTYAQNHSHMPRTWIAGPVFSEFQACMTHKNILCICSGTAITPIMGLAQFWEPENHTVTLIWVCADKSLLPLLLPAVSPNTKVIIYYTRNDFGSEVIEQEDITMDEFFDLPEVPISQVTSPLAPASNKGLEESESGTCDDKMHCKIIPGSLRSWEQEDYDKVVENYIVDYEEDPLADNVVALSFKSKILADKFDNSCKKHKVARVRCDADFG